MKKIQELNNIIKNYGVDHIKFLMIKEYLDVKKINKHLIQKTTLLKNLEKKFQNKSIKRNLLFDIKDLKDLEKNFEDILTFNEKRLEGAIYTPHYIIHNILKKSFDYTKLKKNSIFLDPACGSGAFLINIIKTLLTKKFKFEFIVKNMIYGLDINDQAIFNSKILIELYSLELNCPISSNILNIYKFDFILNNENIILKKLGLKKKIDFICSNPPYIKLQNIDNKIRNVLKKRYSLYFKGSFSTSLCFVIQSLKILGKEGTLGFITQNNLFNSFAAENLRKKLQEDKNIKLIIDFADYKIFEKANAYTALLFFGNNKNSSFDYKKINKDIEEKLKSKIYSKITFNSLNYKKWRLGSNEHLKNIFKIENDLNKLKNIANIRVGIATLKDKVFFVKDSNQIENNITKKLIKINEYKKSEELKKNKLKVIFPYSKIEKNHVPLDPTLLKKKFPKTFKYLLSQKQELAKRSKGKLGLKFFYEWGRIQSMEAPGPKLLTGTFSRGPNFLLDKTDSLFCNGYSLKVKDECIEKFPSIEILQKILNSIVMYYYAKVTSFQISGNFECYQKNFIENFGIPNLKKNEINMIKKYNGDRLDRYLCEIYSLNYKDLQSYISRH
tara:strand:+ start:2538 stop:4373 length:1836 start_codon:yes stop_codon:yes gene_type:complete